MTVPAPETPVNLAPGEMLSIPERLIVAPSSGRFRGLYDQRRPKPGHAVKVGDMIGEVRSLGISTPIRSPFAGFLIDVLAVEGQQVRRGQAIAWMRVPVPTS